VSPKTPFVAAAAAATRKKINFMVIFAKLKLIGGGK
jgi:hypothetical protein